MFQIVFLFLINEQQIQHVHLQNTKVSKYGEVVMLGLNCFCSVPLVRMVNIYIYIYILRLN